MADQKCLQCDRPMVEVGSKSAKVMGDEYYYTYFQCEPCGHYYEEAFHDRFCGPSEVSLKMISHAEVLRRQAEKHPFEE